MERNRSWENIAKNIEIWKLIILESMHIILKGVDSSLCKNLRDFHWEIVKQGIIIYNIRTFKLDFPHVIIN